MIIGLVLSAISVLNPWVLKNIASFFQPAAMVDGCTLLKPEFGRIECEPLQHNPTYNEVFGKPGLTMRCGDNEDTPSCDYYITYRKTSILAPFRCSIEYVTSTGVRNTVNVDDGDYAFAATIPAGGYIKITAKCFGSGEKSAGIKEQYIPYGLNIYDSGLKLRYKTKGCNIVSIPEYQKVCTSGDCGVALAGGANRINWDDWVNYLSDWDTYTFSESKKIVDYNGGQVFCQAGLGLYELGEFTTVDGCYKFPDKLIRYVDCCPGMKTTSMVCQDFKWVPISQAEPESTECMSSMDCPGQGTFVPDYSTADTDIVKYACKNGQCVVAERKTVECQPPAIGCGPGYVCDVKTYRCVKQEGLLEYCGNGYCNRAMGETADNCPTDCAGMPNIVGYFILFVVLFIIFFILVFVVPRIPIPFVKFLPRFNPKVSAMIAAVIALLIVLMYLPFALKVASMVGVNV